MSPKSTAAKSIAEKSSAKKAIFFVDEPEESKKKGDFVMLDTPFSVANTLDNPQGDLGVFFKVPFIYYVSNFIAQNLI